MEDFLRQACRKLRISGGLVAKAKKITADNHLDFLLELFTAELEERDRNLRNAYQKAAKFDVIKTFENYTFEDIKFPTAQGCITTRVNGNNLHNKKRRLRK